MANRVGKGPIGNSGNNGYFSDANFKRLEKVIKLLEQYNKSFDNTTTSMSAYKNIEKALEKRLKLEEELHSLGIKDIQTEGKKYKEQYENEKQIYKEREKQRKQSEKLNEAEKSFDLAIKNNNKTKINQYKQLNQIRDKAIKDASKLNISEKKRNEIIEEQSKAYRALEKSIQQADKKQQLKENVVGTIFGTNSSDIQSINDGTYKFDFATKVFSKAVDTFKTAVKEGIDKNYNTAEQTLNSIVASNSMSYGFGWSKGNFSFGGNTYTGYKQINNAINDQLSSEGLLNNIYNTDVMEAASNLTSSGGLSLESAIAKAYQDTVIRYIVPYLDTSSETFTTLEYLMPGISKNVAATALSAKDQFGENQYIAKYSSQLVELMKPVALSANKELYSAEYQEIAKVLEAQVASGAMDAAQAQKVANEAFSMYMDPTGTIQSGSVLGKMTTINALNSGNIDNPSAYVENYLDNTKWALGLAGNNTITKNIIGNAWGIPDWRNYNVDKINTNNIDTETYDEQLDIFKQQVGLADDMNTTEDQIEKAVTNIMADVGDIKTAIGDKLWGIGEVIVSGITAWLGAKIVSGTIGKAAGIIGGSSAGGTGAGISSLFAGGAGIAVSTAAITAAALAIGSVVADKMWTGSGEHGKETAKEELEGTGLENNSAATTLLATANAQMDAGGFQTTFGNVGAGISLMFSNMFQGKADKNKNFLQWAIQSGALDTGDRNTNLGYLFTLAAIYAQNGYLDAFNKGLNEAGIEGISIKSKEEIGQAMVELGMTKDSFEAYSKKLFSSGWARINTEDGTLENFEIDAKAFGIEGVNGFRYGLNKVPYDDYPALLHKGEAVLTASTANTLRNLLDDYQQTSTQAVNFDTIIQTQTSALIAKMEEIITVISSGNALSSNFTSTPEQTNARTILKHSMLHFTSTKSM